MSDKLVSSLIRSYALKSKDPEIDYDALVSFLQKYADQRGEADVKQLAESPQENLIPALEVLREKEQCSLEYENDALKTITVPQFYRDLVAKAFGALEEDPSTPFPSSSTIGVDIPSDSAQSINVKTDLVEVLKKEQDTTQHIVVLEFPEGVRDLIVPRDLIDSKLIEYSVDKLSLYLQSKNNQGYVHNKLKPVFKGNEILLSRAVSEVATKPKTAYANLEKPDSFHFQFWTHLASLVLKDLKAKREKLDQDHCCCQAAYLMGFFVLFKKGKVQDQSTKKADLKRFSELIEQPPYAYTLDDLYQFADKDGIAFTKKHSKNFIHEYLQEKTHDKATKHLPSIVHVTGEDKKGYFIQKDRVAPLFLDNLLKTAQDLRKSYVEGWANVLKEKRKDPAMRNPTRFRSDLESKLKSSAPLVAALLNPHLLYIVREETEIPPEIKHDMGRFFTKARELRPLDEMLGLDCRALEREARATLPVWETVPGVRHLVSFFRLLFEGGKKKQKSKPQKKAGPVSLGASPAGGAAPAGAGGKSERHSVSTLGAGGKGQKGKQPEGAQKSRGESKAARSKAYKKALQTLKIEFVGSGKSIDQKLSELAEKWNPLFEAKAKADLVEDIDSLVRDFMRSMRRSFSVKPPDANRVRNLAAELAEKKTLGRIKKKDYLKLYMEVYMIKVLETSVGRK